MRPVSGDHRIPPFAMIPDSTRVRLPGREVLMIL